MVLFVTLLKNMFSGKSEQSSENLDENYYQRLGSIELRLKPDLYSPKYSNEPPYQYASLLKISEVYLKGKQLCLESMEAFHPINEVKRQKLTSYWGVRVGTNEWYEILDAYNIFSTDVCSAYSENEMKEIFADELNSKLTFDEKEKLREFYESEFGKKLISATVSANYKMLEASYPSQKAASVKYSEIYNARVQEIYQKSLDKSSFGWVIKILNKIFK